jgi:hypothetical protein
VICDNCQASDPEQPIEIHTSGCRRRHVKPIEGVDERGNLTPSRRRRYELQQERRPAGRARP